MAVKSNLTDPTTGVESHVYSPKNLGFKNPNGLVVYSEPRKVFIPEIRFFSAESGAIDMNIDPTGAGTPENIHNGEDNTYWTASNLVGSNFVFNSTDQANGGTQSIDATATVNNDTALFEDATSISMSDYTALQGAIYITSWPGSGTKEVTMQARLSGTNVGNSINISDYVNTLTLDSWQTFVIPKEDLGLGSDTIDELIVTTIDIGGGQPPNYYLDDLLWVGTGGLTPVEYNVTAKNGENAFISRFDLFMADAVTEAAATAYDKLMGENALAVGITFTRQSGGKILFSSPLKQFSDFIQSGETLIQTGGDGTNRWIKIESVFDPPIQLRRDDYLSMTINDDLTGLLMLRASCRVLVESPNEESRE